MKFLKTLAAILIGSIFVIGIMLVIAIIALAITIVVMGYPDITGWIITSMILGLLWIGDSWEWIKSWAIEIRDWITG